MGRAGSGARLVAGTAAGYALLGALGLTLAIPPSSASPVFPAAGLALAVALRFGPRALAGVWIGSFLIEVAYRAVLGSLTPVTVVADAIIACGATAQAALAAWLVRRWPGERGWVMERGGDAAAFFVAGGLVASLVSASIAMATLAGLGIVPGADWLFSWWSWYLGDALGVLLATPAVLALLDWSGPAWRERRWPVLALTTAMVAFSWFVFDGADRMEKQGREEALATAGTEIADAVTDRLLAHQVALHSLGRMAGELPPDGRPVLEASARGLLDDYPEILAARAGEVAVARAGGEAALGRLSVPDGGWRAGDGSPRAGAKFTVSTQWMLVGPDGEHPAATEVVLRGRPGAAAAGAGGLATALAVVDLDEVVGQATRGRARRGIGFRLEDPSAGEGGSLQGVGAAPPAHVSTWSGRFHAGGRDWVLSTWFTGAHPPRPPVAWAVGLVQLLFGTLVQALLLGATGRAASEIRSSQALRSSEERYRSLLENLGAGVLVYDVGRSTFSIANRAASAFLGAPQAEIEGRSADDSWWALRGEDGALLSHGERPIARVLASGRPIANQVVGYERAGTSELRWALTNAYPVFGPAGTISQVVTTFVDLTERRRAAHAAEERQREIEAMLRTALDGFWIVDLEGRIAAGNPAACAMLGVEPGGLAGVHVNEVDVAERPEETRERLGRIVRDGGAIFESRHRRRDGQLVDVEVSAGYVPGTPGRIFAFVRDVTARKQAEEQLRQAQKMEAVGRLAGGIAHDFNNLLTVMLGAARFAREDAPREGRVREDIEEFTAAAEKARVLTQQLLAFSRRQVLEPRVVDLNALVAETERILLRVLGEQVELRSMLAPRPLTIEADPGQVQQAIVNLAINARDAMPAGGVLTLETSALEVPAGATPVPGGPGPGRWVRLAVVDDGVGMDDELRARIFEPFFTTKPVGKGTGLGLSMVLGIVQQSGGTVRVVSEAGRGARFELHFPRVDRAPEALPGGPGRAGEAGRPGEPAPAEGQGRAPPRSRETILVVEDDDAVRRAAVRLLTRAGYDVLSASALPEAIAAIRGHARKPALLLSDVRMPGHNGPEVAAAVGLDVPGLRTVFMSGYPAEVVVADGVFPSRTHFVQKPFTEEVLLSKIREALDAVRVA